MSTVSQGNIVFLKGSKVPQFCNIFIALGEDGYLSPICANPLFLKNDVGGDDQYVVASATNQHHLSSKDKSISLESKRGESTDAGNT